MTKRLSPERVSAIDSAAEEYGQIGLVAYRDIRGHIDAIEAELEAQKAGERSSTDEFQVVIRVQMKELAEAKAEIDRLEADQTAWADEVVALRKRIESLGGTWRDIAYK